MNESEIKIKIQLDEQNIPEKIMWDADGKGTKGYSETQSMSLALWDGKEKNTLRVDLWSKDMPVHEMKRFYIDVLGGISQTLLNSTGDEYMAGQINQLCEQLIEHVKKEL